MQALVTTKYFGDFRYTRDKKANKFVTIISDKKFQNYLVVTKIVKL